MPAWELVLPQHENRDYLRTRPRMRYSHTATAIGDEVFFTFGYFYDHWDGGSATWHRDVWALAADPAIPAEQRWRLVVDGSQPGSPLSRMNHVAAASPTGASRLAVFGGTGEKEVAYSDLWELDIPSASWRRCAPGPMKGRGCCSGAVVGSSMLIYGGFHLGDLWSYRFDEDRWELLMDAPQEDHAGHPGKRAGHSVVVSPCGGKMYVYGGFRFENDVTDTSLGWGKLEDMWIYHVADNTWERLPQVGGTQGGRQFFSMALVPWWRGDDSDELDGHGLAVFGGTQCNPESKLVGTLTLYSLEEQRWYFINVEEEPLHRYHHTMALCKDALWIHGGETYHPHMYHNSISRFSWPPPRSAATLWSGTQ